MKWMLDNILILIGVTLGFVLFLMGIRNAFKDREARTAADKLLIAASLTILAMTGGCTPRDKVFETCYSRALPAEQTKYDEQTIQIEKRIAEIKADKEWKKLKKVWYKLNDLIKKNENLTSEMSNWQRKMAKKLHQDLEWHELKRKKQKDDARLFSRREALKEMKYLTLELARHIARTHEESTCYIGQGCVQNKPICERETLLNKLYKEGKISARNYFKAVHAMDAFSSRGTFVADRLNKKNTDLIFELIKEISSVDDNKELEMTIVLEIQINMLLKKYNLDGLTTEWEGAQQELLEMGKVIIPKLKEIAKNNKDEAIGLAAEEVLEMFRYYEEEYHDKSNDYDFVDDKNEAEEAP